MSLSALNISKHFGKTTALDNVSLEVKSGQLVALLGPSGSGKTTLLRIMAGLDFPDPDGKARLLFHNHDVMDLPARKRKVGMVFQHYALFRNMNVFDNVAFGMTVVKRSERPSKKEIKDRVAELLAKVHLEGYEGRLPHQLSGGQRQRVALARAVAIRPEILLLDEPFGALDAKVRKELRRWLRAFQEEEKLTTVFVTHDQEEALELADEVVVMNNAHVEQSGSPQEVYDHPASPFVIEFMGNVNLLMRGRKKPGSEQTRLYVRPHDIEVCQHIDGYTLEARILHVFSAGSVGRVTLEYLETGEMIEAEVPRSEVDAMKLTAGQTVGLRFRHTRVFSNRPGEHQELVEVPYQHEDGDNS
jgi:sulfate/thiosulfate transport system ATP-binding protein